MLTPNKFESNTMIRTIKKNYLLEKKQKMNIYNEIKSGRVMNRIKIDEIWRAKAKDKNPTLSSEKKYQFNQIIKYYRADKNEIKGFDSKYILELTDLLSKKDNNFYKKRLELYRSRIKDKKRLIHYNVNKTLLHPYNTANNFYKKQNIQTELDRRQKAFMTFINVSNKNNKAHINNQDISERNLSKQKYDDLYNYNTPTKIKSIKNLISNSDSKSYRKNIIMNTNSPGFLITQYNKNVEEEGDTTSLAGREAFLFSGDQEKYHEFLNKEYNFFSQPKLSQIKYLYEQKKRIKLFKKIPNEQYLRYQKGDPFKTELFKRINREKKNLYLSAIKNLKKNKERKIFIGKTNKSINKGKLLKDYKYLNN